MTELEASICDALQSGISICQRPFQQIGMKVGCTEDQVVTTAKDLQDRGIIRRFGPILNGHALGRFSTLVMAHVPDWVLDRAVNVINGLPHVSHNYIRDHHYNLWFTLQANTCQQAQRMIGQLSGHLGIMLHSLPAVKALKLQAYFPLSGQAGHLAEPFWTHTSHKPTDLQRQILQRMLPQMPIHPRPFAILARGIGGEQEVMAAVVELLETGVIRRIAAILNHYAIGLTVNVLLVAQVDMDLLDQATEPLISSGLVSHLVLRQGLDVWPYNLYAMIHAHRMEQIQSLAQAISGHVRKYLLLKTLRELKKIPAPYELPEAVSLG